jgi:hypothetical protein
MLPLLPMLVSELLPVVLPMLPVLLSEVLPAMLLDAPRPLLPVLPLAIEPVLPAAGLEPVVDADEPIELPDDDGLVLPRLPVEDALCWLPELAPVPLFRLESWFLPMFEPALLASMPLPSLDF